MHCRGDELPCSVPSLICAKSSSNRWQRLSCCLGHCMTLKVDILQRLSKFQRDCFAGDDTENISSSGTEDDVDMPSSDVDRHASPDPTNECHADTTHYERFFIHSRIVLSGFSVVCSLQYTCYLLIYCCPVNRNVPYAVQDIVLVNYKAKAL